MRMRVRKDKFSRAKRSLIMSKIRSKNTKLDLAMKKLLRAAGIKFKMYPKIAGNPDFLVGRKTVVFCDSSFWHGRNWPVLRERLRRGSNSGYWIRHIMKNRARDQKVTRELIGDGYTVVRLWDTQILKDTQYCMRVIRGLLNEPSTIKRKIQDDNLSNNDR